MPSSDWPRGSRPDGSPLTHGPVRSALRSAQGDLCFQLAPDLEDCDRKESNVSPSASRTQSTPRAESLQRPSFCLVYASDLGKEEGNQGAQGEPLGREETPERTGCG